MPNARCCNASSGRPTAPTVKRNRCRRSRNGGMAVHLQIDCCGDGFGDRLSVMTETSKMIIGGGGGFVGGGGGFVGGGGGYRRNRSSLTVTPLVPRRDWGVRSASR